MFALHGEIYLRNENYLGLGALLAKQEFDTVGLVYVRTKEC